MTKRRSVRGRGRYGTGASVRGRGKFSLHRKKNRTMVKRNARRALNHPILRGLTAAGLGMIPGANIATTGAALAVADAALKGGGRGRQTAATNKAINASMNALAGSGRYKRVRHTPPRAPFHNDSVVMATGSKFSAPKFQTGNARGVDAGGLVISHQEFVGNVYGNSTLGGYDSMVYDVNPGLSSTFPMLSQFAQNFDKYEMVQCVFHFETVLDSGTIQSETGQVGQISTYGHVNIKMPTFETVSQFQANGGRSAPTTHGQACGIECSTTQLKGLPNAGINYIRHHPVDDAVEYDQGKFQIAVSNTPKALFNQVLGKLYVSYTVKLIKPRLQSYFARNVRQDVFLATRPKCKLGYQPMDETQYNTNSDEHFTARLNKVMDALGAPNGACASFPELSSEINKSVFLKTGKSNLGCKLAVLAPAQVIFNKAPLPNGPGGQFTHVPFEKGDLETGKAPNLGNFFEKKQGGVIRVTFRDDVKGLVKIDASTFCTPDFKYQLLDGSYDATESELIRHHPPKEESMPRSGQYLNQTRFINRLYCSTGIVPVVHNLKMSDTTLALDSDKTLAGFSMKFPSEEQVSKYQDDERESYEVLKHGHVLPDGNSVHIYVVPQSMDNYVTTDGLKVASFLDDKRMTQYGTPTRTITDNSHESGSGSTDTAVWPATISGAQSECAHASGWCGSASIYLRISEPPPGEENFVDLHFTNVTAQAGINHHHKRISNTFHYTYPGNPAGSTVLTALESKNQMQTAADIFTMFGENGPTFQTRRDGKIDKNRPTWPLPIMLLPLQTRISISQVDDYNITGTGAIHTFEKLYRQGGNVVQEEQDSLLGRPNNYFGAGVEVNHKNRTPVEVTEVMSDAHEVDDWFIHHKLTEQELQAQFGINPTNTPIPV